LPQADGRIKNRPVVVLCAMPPFGDLLVCGVSTQIQYAVPAFDEIIRPGDEDFPPSGLKAASVIRLGFLAVLPRDHFSGKIGSIASEAVKKSDRRRIASENGGLPGAASARILCDT